MRALAIADGEGRNGVWLAEQGARVHVANVYTADLLRDWFGDWDIAHLREHESVIREGGHHHGMSALVDLVASKP